MEDNGISYKELVSEFDEIFQKTKNLKSKIESEIEKIDNTYKNIENEIILSFKKQHLELEEKEKKLKIELSLKVKQIKEELERNLKISSNIILSCEKTNELITRNETKFNNDIKTLYYISEINKNKETAEEFINKKIKNYDISFKSDEYVDYDDYYFNGIPVPKNIKAEKKGEKLYISWNLDNPDRKNIDTDNIKYSLFIQRIGSSFDYDDYETKDKFYYYDDYNEKYDYEIKVRSSFDDYQSEWYKIKKSKNEKSPTLNIFMKDKDNIKKEVSSSTNIFSQTNQTPSLFGSSISVNKNVEEKLFGTKSIFDISETKNNSQENKFFGSLFNNNKIDIFNTDKNKHNELSKNDDDKNAGIFGTNDKGGLFGNLNSKNNNDNKTFSFFK